MVGGLIIAAISYLAFIYIHSVAFYHGHGDYESFRKSRDGWLVMNLIQSFAISIGAGATWPISAPTALLFFIIKWHLNRKEQ
jgi:hypothetical protein